MKPELLKRLYGLSEEQLYCELYCDPLTDVLNRAAFEQCRSTFVAIVDVDSLKFINDTSGYRAGDAYITTTARSLVKTFGPESVYRLGGDEFAIRSNQYGSLCRQLSDLQKQVSTFSFGIGINLIKADQRLKHNKKRREASGCRAPRGEAPPWLKEKTA